MMAIMSLLQDPVLVSDHPCCTKHLRLS